MTAAEFLIDTSSFARLTTNKDLRASWHETLMSGVVGVCAVTELEVLFSAHSRDKYADLRTQLDDGCTWVLMADRAPERALEVQRSLADRGIFRSAGPVDLLVAATAEWHGLTLLHYDRDFVSVAEVTGQPVRWIAEPGTIS